MGRAIVVAVLVAASAASAAPAFAHGGQYRGPGGRVPNDPTPGTGGGGPTPTTDWEAWWSANAWRYLNLRERLRQRDRGGSGMVSSGGLGSPSGAAPMERPAEVLDPRKNFEDEVLPVVIAALQDEDAEVRSAATIALGKMGFARSLLDLRKAVRDPVRDVRDGAVLALGMLGEPFAAEDLRGVLLDVKEQDRTRSFAAVGLGLLGGEEPGRALLDFLDPAADAKVVGGLRRSPLTEASALTGLGMAGFAAAAPSIRKDYDSATRFDPAVRAFGAIALARLADRGAIPSLLQGLDHARDPMRQSAAIALGLLAKPEDAAVIETLAKRLHEEKDVNTRQFCLMSLSRIGGDPAKAAIRKYLEKGPRIDLPLAALAAALGKDREALPAVRKMFEAERQPSVKSGYAIALGLYGDLESAETMRKLALAQGESELRVACMTALGLMNDGASAAPVRALIDTENDPAIRLGAATCLGLLQDRAVVEVLESLAKDGGNALLRSGACRLLGHVGAPRSSKLLIAIVKDPKDNSIVRMAATAALGNLCDRALIPQLAQIGIDSNYASSVDPLIEIATIQ